MQRHPALEAIARDTHRRLVIVKSAQVGMTELAVNMALHASATGFAGRGNVLFVMPTQNVMEDFASQRFGRAIQDSPWFRSLVQPEPPRRKGADSRRLKHFGAGWIFLRSADRGQLASVDADWVFLDEADLMDEAAYGLAEKRLASSRDGRLWIMSTPRYPGDGVHGLYLASDRRRFFIPCPACSHEQYLTWEDNVDQASARVVCRLCRESMNVLAEGRWIAEAPGNDDTHGYHLSRLYSPWANIPAMIEASRSTTPWGLQEFQNSDLGEPFILPDGGLQKDELDRCRADYSFDDYQGQECVMGVDVGTSLNVVCRESSPRDYSPHNRPGVSGDFRPRLWFAGTVKSFADLDAIIARYHVRAVNFDSKPETHKATEFARALKVSTFLTDYSFHEPGAKFQQGRPGRISANRTDVMDQLAAMFRDMERPLPRDARFLGGPVKDGSGEYYRQVIAAKRTYVRDGQGNTEARWVDNYKADYFHAEVYCMLADQYKDSGTIKAW